jgi:hypothetical protein
MPSQKSKVPPPAWEVVNLPLVKLHLDLENYRHVPVASEDEAIKQLFVNEKVEALARDIVAYGSTSPLERIGVFPMPKNPEHFIAVEGNRRVCALLLLNDPDRAPTPTDRKAFRALAKGFTIPPIVEVVKFRNKTAAKHWVDLRHLGPQEGQGLRTWNNKQKNRAAGDKASDPLAMALLDRAREGGWLPEGETPAPTTLTRYLKNREVRAALGLGHHKELLFTHDQAEVDAALRQFLLDALPRSDGTPGIANSRSKDADRAAYARALRDRGVAPQTTLAEPIRPTAPAAGKPSTKRSKQDPFKRLNLIPKGFVVRCSDPNLRALFAEMRITTIDHHEFANAYLLRAFIERVMTLYVHKLEPSYNWGNDQGLVNKCSALLDPEKKSPLKLKPLRTAANKADSSHSLHTLGAAVHAGLLMDRRALIAAWQNWEVALTLMLEPL